MILRLTPFLTLMLLAACKAPRLDAFEQNVPIKGGAWSYTVKPSVTFNITDTASLYNVSVVCRHTDGYGYKNIWLFIAFQRPGDTASRKDRFELTLQDNKGRWYGTGMDDIWEQRIPLFKDIHFNRPGPYTVTFEQDMRDNALKGVLDIGLRVEKAP